MLDQPTLKVVVFMSNSQKLCTTCMASFYTCLTRWANLVVHLLSTKELHGYTHVMLSCFQQLTKVTLFSLNRDARCGTK